MGRGALGALVESGEQLVNKWEGELQVGGGGGRRRALGDLADGRHRVRNDHRDRVVEKLAQQVQEVLLLHQLRVHVVQLRHADRCRLANVPECVNIEKVTVLEATWNEKKKRIENVRVLVFEALAKRLREVLCDLLDTDAAHRSYCQSPDQRVRVVAVAYERVHRHNCEVWLAFRVVHEVQIY